MLLDGNGVYIPTSDASSALEKVSVGPAEEKGASMAPKDLTRLVTVVLLRETWSAIDLSLIWPAVSSLKGIREP